MTAQTKTVLKGYFNTGDTPTEAQFTNLIDSIPGDAGALADADIPAAVARDSEVTTAIGTHNSLATAHGLTADISAALAAAANPSAANPLVTATQTAVSWTGTHRFPTLGVGDNVAATDLVSLYASDSVSNNHFNIQTTGYAAPTGNTAFGIYGVYSVLALTAAHNIGNMANIKALNRHNATGGTIGTMIGFHTYPYMMGATGAGAVTALYDFLIGMPVRDSGNLVDIATHYGIRIENLGDTRTTTGYAISIENQTGSGTNYAIVTGSGLNRLGDQLDIIGSADRPQLIVRSNGTQSNYLAEFYNASSQRNLYIASDLSINMTGTRAAAAFTSTLNTTTDGLQGNTFSIRKDGGSGELFGINLEMQNNSASYATIYGLTVNMRTLSTANLAQGDEIALNAQYGTGRILAHNGLHINTPSLGGGGQIDVVKAINVEAQTTGVLNYAIYTAGGRVHFGSLPTSAAGLAAGDVWSNGGVLTIV
jgi:hypothetical protein